MGSLRIAANTAAVAASIALAPVSFASGQTDTAGYWDKRCDELRQDKFSNRTVELSQPEFLEYLRELETINPDKNWKQIATALHGASYTDDLDRTLPGTPIRLFENGQESEGWQSVDVGCGIAPLSSLAPAVVPKFVHSTRGRKIDVGHTYAGIRSDLNRTDKDSAWALFMRNANTSLGDIWQVVSSKGNTNYFPADQLRGNLMGLQIARHTRNPHLQENINDLGLVDFFEQFFDDADAANEREEVVAAVNAGSDGGAQDGKVGANSDAVGSAPEALQTGAGETGPPPPSDQNEQPAPADSVALRGPDIPAIIASIRAAIRLNAEGAEGITEFCSTLEDLPELGFGEGSPGYFYKTVIVEAIVRLLEASAQHAAQIGETENAISSAVRASELAVEAASESCTAATQTSSEPQTLDGQILRSRDLSNLVASIEQTVRPKAEALLADMEIAENSVPEMDALKQELANAEAERQGVVERACAKRDEFALWESRLREGGFRSVTEIKGQIATLRAAILNGPPDAILEYGLDLNALGGQGKSLEDVHLPASCSDKSAALGKLCKTGRSASGIAAEWLSENQEWLVSQEETLSRISVQRSVTAERIRAALERLETAVEAARLASSDAFACRDRVGDAADGVPKIGEDHCDVYMTQIGNARPLLNDGDTTSFRREIEAVEGSIGEAERLACPELEDDFARARQQSNLIDQVATINADILLSCNIASMREFADRLRKTEHVFVANVRQTIEALIPAVETYQAALTELHSGGLDAAETGLKNAHLRIQRIAPQSCPNIRTALAEAMKTVAERRQDETSPQERVAEANRHCRNYLGEYANAVRDDTMESGYRCSCVKPDGGACRETGVGTQTAGDRNAECVRLNGRGFVAGQPRSDGRYDCIPNRQTANAWCAKNSGRGHFAGKIRANGSFQCFVPRPPTVRRRVPPVIGLVPPTIGLVMPPTTRTGGGGGASGGGCVPCPSLFLPSDETAAQCRAGGYTTNRNGSWYKCL